MTSCPCQSGLAFDACCGPILAGTPAPTAEALMRSRYSAYARREIDYINRTQAPTLRQATAEQAEAVEWFDLQIRAVIDGGVDDQTGQVEFIASYRRNGKKLYQHELSSFGRENGQWIYLSSEFNPKSKPVINENKTGRNDSCPCGSGKKYKKCCGA